jgi:hypothetical protein
VRQLIRSAGGAKLFFLPKYSPDLNPHRTGLCSSNAPQGGGAHIRGNLPRPRQAPSGLRMRQLLRKLRLPTHSNTCWRIVSTSQPTTLSSTAGSNPVTRSMRCWWAIARRLISAPRLLWRRCSNRDANGGRRWRAWAACILYRAGNDERWQGKDFYALASAMVQGRALKEIPLMYKVASQTVSAWRYRQDG